MIDPIEISTGEEYGLVGRDRGVVIGITVDPESGLRSGVYQIRCIVNGKIYIGSAVYIKRRWCTHLNQLADQRHHSHRLQAAWNVYGAGAFVFEVLEWVEPVCLVEREQFYIDTSCCADQRYGFNACLKADSKLGYKHSEEARKKMVESGRRRKHSEETKQKMREAVGRRVPISEETRKKMREACIRRKPMSEEHKKKIGIANTGRKRSEEAKEKMREIQLGHEVNEETRRKLSEINRGKKHTEETRQKMREAHIGKTPSDETRQKIREAHLGMKHTEETKQKMREFYSRREES